MLTFTGGMLINLIVLCHTFDPVPFKVLSHDFKLDLDLDMFNALRHGFELDLDMFNALRHVYLLKHVF